MHGILGIFSEESLAAQLHCSASTALQFSAMEGQIAKKQKPKTAQVVQQPGAEASQKAFLQGLWKASAWGISEAIQQQAIPAAPMRMACSSFGVARAGSLMVKFTNSRYIERGHGGTSTVLLWKRQLVLARLLRMVM